MKLGRAELRYEWAELRKAELRKAELRSGKARQRPQMADQMRGVNKAKYMAAWQESGGWLGRGSNATSCPRLICGQQYVMPCFVCW